MARMRIEKTGEQAKKVCLAAINRLNADTQVETINRGMNARRIVLVEPEGREMLGISQILESPVKETVGVVVIKSEVATPSLGGGFQSGFTLHLDRAILLLSNREAVAKVPDNRQIFGDDLRITALVNAITRWPVCN